MDKKIIIITSIVVICLGIGFSISVLYQRWENKKSIQESQAALPVNKLDISTSQVVDHSKQRPLEKPALSLGKKLPTIPFGLELKGTIVSEDSDPFAVILVIKKKQEILVKEGDTVGAIVIKQILKEKVLLWMDGRQEFLFLKQGKSDGVSPGTLISGKENESQEPEFVDRAVITWADIDSLGENLWDLSKQIRVFPHFAKGHMDGFRISGIKEDEFFYKKLGLRNGDIVSGVNGKNINSVKDIPNIYDVFEQLESTGSMVVDIKRDSGAGKIRVSIE